MIANPSRKGLVGADVRRIQAPKWRGMRPTNGEVSQFGAFSGIAKYPLLQRLTEPFIGRLNIHAEDINALSCPLPTRARPLPFRYSRRSSEVAILAIALLLASCGEKPRSNAKDFSKSNSVSAVLGDPAKENGNGLQHIYFEEDGRTTPAKVGDVHCRSLKLEGTNYGYFYFMIDPSFKRRNVKNVRIEVEYLDEKPGVLGLQFDATGSKKINEPAYTEVDRQVHLTGSRIWQTATFQVHGATFKNRQNSRSDFRFCANPPELYVRHVTVSREPSGAFLKQATFQRDVQPLERNP